MGLEWLISPVSFAAFRDQYWSQRILRITRRDPFYYASLFSEADLEETLLTASRVGRAVEELTEDENPRPTRGHAGALAVLRAGKSLRISGIQRFSLKLAKLSYDLEQIFSTPININLYLSPSSKKALSRHFDTHDVFVMQLFGRKVWTLYGPPTPHPLEFVPLLPRELQRDMKHYRLESEKIKQNRLSTQLTEEFVLNPGDLLYLPRGFWHEAETEPGSVSCHLTVGVLPTTYLDLLTAALAQAAITDLGLRGQLPLGFATHADAGEEAAHTLASILDHLPAKIDAKAALGQMGNIFHRHRRDSLENRLLKPLQASESDKIDVDSWIRVRNGLVIGVDQTLTPAEFVFGPNGFQIDPSFVEACRFMCRQQHRFTPAMLPGDLTDEQKVILVKQLITENVLLPSEEGVDKAGLDDSHRSLSNWVPCNLHIKDRRVRWVLLDETGMRDPFLFQTVRRRRAENPACIRETGLGALLQMKEDLHPCGFIFNVSRCGSTMLANALRSFKGSIVVSEPRPISQLLTSTDEWKAEGVQMPRGARLLRGLLRAYGQRRGTEERSLVIKFTSWNLVYIAEIRRLWPDVPCVILVRNPLEVAVSCIAQPAAWMRNQGVLEGFPASALDIQGDDTPEAACAHVLGAFFKVAAKQVDELCHVVDYEELDATAIVKIARFFKMPISIERDGEALNLTLSTYSKDPLASRPFTADFERKRASASDLLRYEVERWAEPYYAEVRRAAMADTFLVNSGST